MPKPDSGDVESADQSQQLQSAGNKEFSEVNEKQHTTTSKTDDIFQNKGNVNEHEICIYFFLIQYIRQLLQCKDCSTVVVDNKSS